MALPLRSSKYDVTDAKKIVEILREQLGGNGRLKPARKCKYLSKTFYCEAI